jgi:hypothetical protein
MPLSLRPKFKRGKKHHCSTLKMEIAYFSLKPELSVSRLDSVGDRIVNEYRAVGGTTVGRGN